MKTNNIYKAIKLSERGVKTCVGHFLPNDLPKKLRKQVGIFCYGAISGQIDTTSLDTPDDVWQPAMDWLESRLDKLEGVKS